MIRLDQFATGATQGIEDAIKGAKADGAKKIVLDLRGNPGGYVNEAVGVASQFVGDGTVYQSVDASGVEKDVPVQPGGLATEHPARRPGRRRHGELRRDRHRRHPGRGPRQGRRREDVRDGHGARPVRPLGRLVAADRRRALADPRRAARSGTRASSLTSRSRSPTRSTPLLPDDLRDMTPASLAKSDDTQLLKALELLKGEG